MQMPGAENSSAYGTGFSHPTTILFPSGYMQILTETPQWLPQGFQWANPQGGLGIPQGTDTEPDSAQRLCITDVQPENHTTAQKLCIPEAQPASQLTGPVDPIMDVLTREMAEWDRREHELNQKRSENAKIKTEEKIHSDMKIKGLTPLPSQEQPPQSEKRPPLQLQPLSQPVDSPEIQPKTLDHRKIQREAPPSTSPTRSPRKHARRRSYATPEAPTNKQRIMSGRKPVDDKMDVVEEAPTYPPQELETPTRENSETTEGPDTQSNSTNTDEPDPSGPYYQNEQPQPYAEMSKGQPPKTVQTTRLGRGRFLQILAQFEGQENHRAEIPQIQDLPLWTGDKEDQGYPPATSADNTPNNPDPTTGKTKAHIARSTIPHHGPHEKHPPRK